ncbi:MAG: hypothetical protein JSS87_00290 [Acidobacteria bacterium]|nr:hypothetical protein [Acidobacteriota bacterium]
MAGLKPGPFKTKPGPFKTKPGPLKAMGMFDQVCARVCSIVLDKGGLAN